MLLIMNPPKLKVFDFLKFLGSINATYFFELSNRAKLGHLVNGNTESPCKLKSLKCWHGKS